MTIDIENEPGVVRVANVFEEAKLGGPQIYVMRLAAGLRNQVDMTLIIPEENSDSFRVQCELASLKYKVLKISRITKEWKAAVRYLLFSSWEIARLASLFRKDNYDVVYVCGGSWQYKGVIAGKLAGKLVLWHINDTSMPWALRQIFSFLSPRVDGFVYASERSREYYGSLVKRSIPEFVIPAPVDTSLFDPAHQYSGDEDYIERWNGKTVIGTVANINPVKGLEVFIRAAAALEGQAENVVFVVVGETYGSQQRYFGELQQLRDRLLVDNIEFVGGRADVRPLLQRFNVYVCSSRSESSPISVWEALAMAKPVVATDVGDVPLYVREEYNGFIVDVGDSAALSERLASLIGDEVRQREFGRRGREIAVGQLDVEHCARRHLDSFRQVINHRK